MKNLAFGVFLESISSKNSGVYPSQPRYSLLQDTAICGVNEPLGLMLRFIVLPKVLPLLVLFLKSISPFPKVKSYHTTYTLLPDTAICGLNESPGLVLSFIILPKVLPLLVILLKNISLLPGVKSCHTT